MCLHATVSVRVAMMSLPAPLAIKGSARNQQDVRLTSRSPPITGQSIGASLLLADSLASLGAKDTKEKEKTNDGLTKKSKFVPCQALCGEQFPRRLVGIYSFPKHKYTHTLYKHKHCYRWSTRCRLHCRARQ